MKTIVFDNETTGLLNHPDTPIDQQPHIIEFAAALIDENCKVLKTIDKLIHPGCDLPDPEMNLKVSGITDEMLVHEGNFSERFKKINKFIKQGDVMIAHNLSFDKGMMEVEMQRLDRQFIFPTYGFCTVQINVPLYGYRVKLKDLYQDVVGKPLKQTHRALDDVLALVDIIREGNYLEAIAASIKS